MHYKQTGFAYQHIVFPLIPVIVVTVLTDLLPLPVAIERYVVFFAPVMGNIRYDEVYVPAPTLENPNAAISGTRLAEIANRRHR